MFREYGKRLMNELDDGGDLGGGAPPQAGGFGDEAPPTNQTPPAPTELDLSGVPEWAKSLEVDEDILKDPSLKAINDLNSLAKSYVHAQRKIGQKGTLIPTENSTKEEWDTFYQKTGVPLEEQDYVSKVEFPSQEEGAAFGDEFNAEFVKKAHELRIRPDQASQMYRFFNEQAKNTSTKFQEQMEQTTQQELNQLRDSLGEEAYSVKLNKAAQFIKEELGEEFHTYLKESGLGKNAKLVNAFMKIADAKYGEDKLPDGSGSGTMTKAQMEQEINLALGNPNDPYLNSNHPDHKRRVDEIQKYFAKLEK